jgi:glycosyltransferase involved in cell wall biosynthesis
MNRPLRIAQITTERGFSGGEVQLLLLVEGLRRHGHRIVVICPPHSRTAQEAAQRNIDHVAISMRNGIDLVAVLRLVLALRSFDADLVHLHSGRANWLGGLAARSAGKPAVSTRRMDRRVKRNWRTQLIYGRLVQRVVSISPAVTQCLTEGGVPLERIRLVYEAVDPDRLRPAAGRDDTRVALGALSDERVLLTLAALIQRKGVDVLLDALALLSREGLRPWLWVAGDGPERQALAARAARLGIADRVRFLGERRDTGDLLAASDIFVLPSRREGLGVSALEAMAAGRAVVCSAVGGLQYSVVEGRTGLLFPPGDATALAEALARALREDDLRDRLAGAGPARIAEGFLAEQMIMAHLNLYGEMLRGLSPLDSPATTNLP